MGSCLLAGACGSGTAALFSGAGGTTNTPQVFQVNLAASQPALSPNLGTAIADQNASTRVLRINFNQAIDITTVQTSDFCVNRVDEDNNVLEVQAIDQVLVEGSDVLLILDFALHLNGLYQIEFTGNIQAANGTNISGDSPRAGHLRVGTGQFDAVEAVVAFGNLAAGGIRLAPDERSFVSLEARFTDFSTDDETFILAASAGVSDIYDTPELIFINDGNGFNSFNTSSIQFNGDTAAIRVQEGNLTENVHNNARSIRLRGFPGAIENGSDRIAWPSGVTSLSAEGVDQYTMDKGPLFGALAGGIPVERTISWRPRMTVLSADQVPGPRGRLVGVWWAWSDPTDSPASERRYNRYHVVANALDVQADLNTLDPASLEDWPDAIVLSTDLNPGGEDVTVGWPFTTVWDNGNVLALWHDADSLAGVYRGDIQTIKGSRYDAANNSWSTVATYAPTNPIGRIGDIKPVSDNEVLVFARFDEDGIGAVGGVERASVRIRRLQIGPDGSIQDAPGSSEVIAGPSADADGFYGIGLDDYAEAINGMTGLPNAEDYNMLRGSDIASNPSATAIRDNLFLVQWSAEDNATGGTCAPQIFLALFNSDSMSFVDPQPLEVLSNAGIDVQNSSLIGVQIDRLGFATLVFSDEDQNGDGDEPGPTIRIRAIRSVASLASSTLAQAFPSNAPAEVIVEVEDAGQPDNEFSLRAVQVSNVNDSGHVAVSWARAFIPQATGNVLIVGTNSKTLR